MYDNLVRELQCCPDGEYGCSRCEHRTSLHCRETLMKQAADAIEQLDKDLERAKEWASFWEKEATEALRRFQVAIASKPRWIPVTERLPEPGVPCLCWCKGGTFGQIRWYGLYYLTSHRTWAIYDNDYENQEVTHWMYRPEPPKEEKE